MLVLNRFEDARTSADISTTHMETRTDSFTPRLYEPRPAGFSPAANFCRGQSCMGAFFLLLAMSWRIASTPGWLGDIKSPLSIPCRSEFLILWTPLMPLAGLAIAESRECLGSQDAVSVWASLYLLVTSQAFTAYLDTHGQ